MAGTKVFRKEKQTIQYLVGFHFGRDMSPSEEVKGDPANESKTISLVCQYSDFYFNSSVRYRWSAHQGSMYGKKVRQKANLLLINQTMLLLLPNPFERWGYGGRLWSLDQKSYRDKERAAQKARSWTARNEMKCPGSDDRRDCINDSRFYQF